MGVRRAGQVRGGGGVEEPYISRRNLLRVIALRSLVFVPARRAKKAFRRFVAKKEKNKRNFMKFTRELFVLQLNTPAHLIDRKKIGFFFNL